jgi:hypothetical protein
MIKSALYLPASRPRIFAVLTSYPKYSEWLPGCDQCVVVSTQGSVADTEIVFSSPKRLEARLRFEAHENEAIHFQLSGAKELKTYAGVYRLADAADGKGTVLFSELELEAKSIPKFITDGMAKKSLKDAGAALKRYVERLPAEGSQPQSPSHEARPVRFRARRLVQIVKDPKGYRVWLMGESFRTKNIPGNLFEG